MYYYEKLPKTHVYEQKEIKILMAQAQGAIKTKIGIMHFHSPDVNMRCEFNCSKTFPISEKIPHVSLTVYGDLLGDCIDGNSK